MGNRSRRRVPCTAKPDDRGRHLVTQPVFVAWGYDVASMTRGDLHPLDSSECGPLDPLDLATEDGGVSSSRDTPADRIYNSGPRSTYRHQHVPLSLYIITTFLFHLTSHKYKHTNTNTRQPTMQAVLDPIIGPAKPELGDLSGKVSRVAPSVFAFIQHD